ncbi:MAG: hypothetical protein H0T46_27800 [Deltaproteobacteria bacterium]|nr:hypothetical protein [Deltaproteobacteria bacterium]
MRLALAVLLLPLAVARNWYKRGLVVKDFQHPTTSGAAMIAAALFAGLVGR